MIQPPSLPPNATEDTAPFEPIHRSCWGHFLHCLRHYFDFSGRSTRAEFFSFNAIATLVVAFLFLVPFSLGVYQTWKSCEQDKGLVEKVALWVAYATELDNNFYQENTLMTPSLFRFQYDYDDDDFQLYELGEEQYYVPGEETLLGNMADKVAFEHLSAELLMKISDMKGPIMICVSLLLWGVGIFAILIPSYAVFWRRLHDIGLSGAVFFLSAIPIFGWIVLLVLCLIDSKPGANSYGPPTKYP